MKKYFFLAILASLIILPSCKKESGNTPETTPDGQTLIATYDAGSKIIGVKIADAKKALMADGWQCVTEEGEYSFLKTSTTLGIEIDPVLSYDNTDTIIRNVDCYVISLEKGDGCMRPEDMKALLQHIGKTPTINKEQLAFVGLGYDDNPVSDDFKYTVTDYQEAIDKVSEACTHTYMGYSWAAEVNTIEVIKGIELGMRAARITIGDISEPE